MTNREIAEILERAEEWSIWFPDEMPDLLAVCKELQEARRLLEVLMCGGNCNGCHGMSASWYSAKDQAKCKARAFLGVDS